MMRIILVVLFLVFLGINLSLGKDIDPLLKTLMISKGVLYHKGGFGVLPVDKFIGSENFFVFVNIISSRPYSTHNYLNSMGYKSMVYGGVLTVKLDIRDIQNLITREEVVYISPSIPKRLYLDRSVPFVKADLVHSAFRLPFPVTGKGVVLGITDTGIDYTHPDFITDDGEVRTRYIWYQDINPNDRIPPEEYGYGDECNPERIISRKCPYKDVIGHGTHCAGIMGSDSRRYRGIAYEGVFVVAKSGTFENLIDAIGYVLKRADYLKMPVVINMSLGGHYGPHDGRSPEELAIAEMLKEGKEKGKIIVVAAGNEGSSNIHLGYQADSTPKKTLMNIKSSSGPAIINLWFSKDKSLEVAIGISRDGIDELAETEYFSGGDYRLVPITYDGKKYADVEFNSAYYPPSNKMMYLIRVDKNCGNCVDSSVNFYIKARGDAYFDAWFADEDFFSGGSSFSTRSDNGLIPGDSKKTIGMPATSPYVISVAAAVSRKEYVDIERKVHTLRDNPGDIAYFSSIGPSASEDITGPKPDITAPGRIIVSSFSSDAIQLQPGTQVDRFHIAMQGTSMACPHVAGLVGLMLSINPELSFEEAKRIIRLTATKPYEDFAGFDYRWGYGLMNAYEAVRMALKIGICEENIDCKENMICRNNYCRGLVGFECESNLDCDIRLICENRRCLSTFNGECKRDSDCAQNLSCVANKCLYPKEIEKGGIYSEGFGCSCNLIY
ncbi:MAG: S8 family serine peptidase [Deltaproteobacteria bacterium]|nr:S8 family serine peptidase [Deltaproteobacteria bacterium]